MVLNQNDIADILEVHKKHGGDLTKMKKDLPFAEETIIKYLELNEKDYYYGVKWQHDAQTVKRIQRAHGPSNGVARVAARNLGVSYHSVLKYWRAAELPIRKRGGNTRNLESRLNK